MECLAYFMSWTLQELIAPETVIFYDKQWNEIGTKRTASLQTVIVEKTGIREDVWSGSRPIFDCRVAERMSWAASRETSREEDMAYCLLGLFDTNMLLIYGEGAKAFQRLQEEILKRNADHLLLHGDGCLNRDSDILAFWHHIHSAFLRKKKLSLVG